MATNTKHWDEYQRILNFQKQDGIANNTRVNDRMYALDQWFHVGKTNQLPKVIIDFTARSVDFVTSVIMDPNIKLNFAAQPYDDKEENAEKYDKAAELFTRYAESVFEEINQASLNEEMIRDSNIVGLGLIHYYLDPDMETGNGFVNVGGVEGEIIDAINYFPADPTERRIQKQKRIHLTYRKDIESIKAIAKADGMSKEEIAMITPDNDTQDQAFDKAQEEVSGSKKATVLLTYYHDEKTKTKWSEMSVKSMVFKKATDTKRPSYPLTGFNGKVRKRSVYGTALVTAIVPNQIFVNTLYAMTMVSVQRTAYPKAFYDKTKISAVTNGVGGAYGINGPVGNDVFRYEQTGQVAFDVYKLIDDIVSRTKEAAGLTDAILGDVNPDNTSAIMLVQKQSNVPFESPQRRFYATQEEAGRILSEFWQYNFSTTRIIELKNDDGTVERVKFDPEEYKDIRFNIKADVGSSSQYSEIVALNTLEKWATEQKITFTEQLERMPKNIIPKLQALIDSRKQVEESTEPSDEEIQAFVQTLPPETQQQLAQMSEEEGVQAVMQMMGGQQ